MAETTPLKHQFVWFDLETTGLLDDAPGGAYSDGTILEVAFALADDLPDGTFEVVKAEHFAIRHDVDSLEMSDHVLRMHSRAPEGGQSLLDACAEATITLDEADEFLCFLVDEWCGKTGTITLAGNSVHFDQNWCRLRLPKFAQRLHHRVFDVSTLLRVYDTYGVGERLPKKEPAHRAYADVLQSLATAKAWVEAARTAQPRLAAVSLIAQDPDAAMRSVCDALGATYGEAFEEPNIAGDDNWIRVGGIVAPDGFVSESGPVRSGR